VERLPGRPGLANFETADRLERLGDERFNWLAMRVTVLVLSGVFLAYGVIHIATLPTL
jgi:hypothetical protein